MENVFHSKFAMPSAISDLEDSFASSGIYCWNIWVSIGGQGPISYVP